MFFRELKTGFVCDVLSNAGINVGAADVFVEAHEERWLVRLPQRRLAWFAASEDGLRRLQTERRVLRSLESRCSFRAPRVLFESAEGGFDVREMVPGASQPVQIWQEVRASADLASQVGAQIGRILAEQHSRIGATEVAGWLPRRPAWPETADRVLRGLRRVWGDRGVAVGATILAAYEDASSSHEDCALVHTDVGFHNVAIDPDTHAVNGLFDYDEAAWVDRHHDFRYLVFDIDRWELLDAAAAVYEAHTGLPIQRQRVLLYNAACALGFLAHRADRAPDERSSGRTLTEDLQWSKLAVSRVLGAERAAELEVCT